MEEEFSPKDINEKALYVLKVDDKGTFYTDYLPIVIDINLLDSIKILEDNIEKRIKNEVLNANKQEIYAIKTSMILAYWEDIRKNYPCLLGYRSYCYPIYRSYCEWQGINQNFEMKFQEFDDSINVKIKNKDSYVYYADKDGNRHFSQTPNNNYISIDEIFTNNFFYSYFIEQAYNECKNNSNIKAYSHRKIGWKLNDCHIELNDFFSIYLKTNFGFGCTNYFRIIFIFKGIQLTVYSTVILYRQINVDQLIEYTWEFGISDSCWKDAFDKIRNACNYYLLYGEDYFIKIYIVDELEIMTNELPTYLQFNKFTFDAQYGEDYNKYGKIYYGGKRYTD
jgi:hypothetical protein